MLVSYQFDNSGPFIQLADFLLIESSADGGPFVRLASFRSTGGGFNTSLSEDTTNKGMGDGTLLTSGFQNFSYTLPVAGLTVVRISAMSNAVGEEMAWDNVCVTGTESISPIADFADPVNGGAIVSNELNTRGFIDVTFSDVDSALDPSTITDAGESSR